jgi:tRNA(Arg) A34 adenosine deaminase TadA
MKGMDPSRDAEFLAEALELATRSARASGGPFGALVVQGGAVLGRGTNRVTELHDPTAHAEVSAIRAACQELGNHSLAGAVLYTSCEPCPMCLAAAWWARIERIVHCATRADAAEAGFDDELLYRELALPLEARRLPLVRALPHRAAEPFRAFAANPRRVPY